MRVCNQEECKFTAEREKYVREKKRDSWSEKGRMREEDEEREETREREAQRKKLRCRKNS